MVTDRDIVCKGLAQDNFNVYGGYAIKLLRLQNEMIQTFERYRRQ